MFNKINLFKIITSINKTLSVANKAIPLYQQVKPLLSNASNLKNIIEKIPNQTIKNRVNIKKEEQKK